jgi:hypothetical protein
MGKANCVNLCSPKGNAGFMRFQALALSSKTRLKTLACIDDNNAIIALYQTSTDLSLTGWSGG